MSAKTAAKSDTDRLVQTWRGGMVRLLLGLAMGVSLYLLYVSLAGGAVAGCGPESACDRVLKSRWAYWLGVPVSAPALLVYASLFGATIALKRATAPELRRKIWPGMFLLALMILGAGAWFITLMVFVIQGICPFCLAAHGAGITAALLVVLNAPVRPAPELPWQKEKHLYLPPVLARKLAAMAGVGLALLVSGQVLYKKQMNIVQAIPPAPLLTNSTLQPPPPPPASATQRTTIAITSTPALITPTPPPAVAPKILPPPTNKPSSPPLAPPLAPATIVRGRIVSTHNGRFYFNLDELPVMGNSQATNVVISLFDYTCHHCHTMHGHLLEALRYFSNRLAIISLPMPLDAECNPLIRRTHRDASNACHYARLGLAVWRSNRARWQEFDNYLFSGDRPPPLSAASDYAANLIGANNLGRALADPWIESRIKTHISIYHTNAIILKNNGAMPQLVAGAEISAGSVNNAGEVIRFIQKNLGLP